MENQINTGDQNAQQIGQNPVSQSVITPEKPKTNYLLFGGIVLVCFMIFGYGGYYFGKQSTSSPITSGFIQPSPTTISTPIHTIAPSPTSETNNQMLKTYDSTFITLQYPINWYVWSYGRGVSLDYFQINTIPQSQADKLDSVNVRVNDLATIAFDIQTLGYTSGQTLEEQKKNSENLQKQYPEDQYVMSQQTIDGINALVYVKGRNNASYSKTVWLIKNNVKYIISLNIYGYTLPGGDKLASKVKPVFENILSTIKLKNVDPAEVNRLGNHPD